MLTYNTPETPHPKNLWRLWAGRLSAILFGISLGIFLLEVLLRLAYPLLPYNLQEPLRYVKVTPFTDKSILPPPDWYPVERYQFATRPNLIDKIQYPNPNLSFHITTKNWLDPQSNIGFRVPTPNWEPLWPIDAVMIGDSFTFCFTEYEDCWVRQLEERHNLSVVNLGQGATGSLSHLNILLTFGLPYEPKAVVWQWYGNDFNEDYGFTYQSENVGTSSSNNYSETALAQWIRGHSAVYWVLNAIINSDTALERFNVQVDPYYLLEGDLNMSYGRRYSIESGDLNLEKNQLGFELTQSALLTAQSELQQRNIPLLVVLIPFKEEVYAHLMADTLGQKTITALQSSRQAMLTFCQEAHLTCLDLTPELIQRAQAGEQLYWSSDTHLNPLGNTLLADQVATYLQTILPTE